VGKPQASKEAALLLLCECVLTLQDGYVQGCALILVLGLQVGVIIWQQLLFTSAATILQADACHAQMIKCSQPVRNSWFLVAGRLLQLSSVKRRSKHLWLVTTVWSTHHIHLLLQVCGALLQQLLQAVHVTSCCCIV
jgi:hypothetical protein